MTAPLIGADVFRRWRIDSHIHKLWYGCIWMFATHCRLINIAFCCSRKQEQQIFAHHVNSIPVSNVCRCVRREQMNIIWKYLLNVTHHRRRLRLQFDPYINSSTLAVIISHEHGEHSRVSKMFESNYMFSLTQWIKCISMLFPPPSSAHSRTRILIFCPTRIG